MVVLSSVSGSYILNKIWWLDNAIKSSNCFILLSGTEKGYIPWAPLHLGETMWLNSDWWYWPKVKYATFSELAIKYPSQLPPYFFSISMSKKVAELCNVRSLDKWGFFFEEKHWGKPSDQEYINRARQELERKIFTGFSHCNLGICLLQQYTLAYFD